MSLLRPNDRLGLNPQPLHLKTIKTACVSLTALTHALKKHIFLSLMCLITTHGHFTTFCGWPSIKAFALRVTMSMRRVRASLLAQPMWGVM